MLPDQYSDQEKYHRDRANGHDDPHGSAVASLKHRTALLLFDIGLLSQRPESPLFQIASVARGFASTSRHVLRSLWHPCDHKEQRASG